MNWVKNNIVLLLIIFVYLIIFNKWLMPGILSGGDWPYIYPQAVLESVPFSSWETIFSNGTGMSSIPKIWFDAYALTILEIANILSWPIFERVVWFFPYLFLSFFSAYFLSKKFFKDKNFSLLSGLIYSLNTYSLLIVSGGQAGVFTAYAFLPFVFYSLFNLLEKFTLKRSLFLSFSLAVLIMLDLRVGYMFLLAEGIISLIFLVKNKSDFVLKITYLFLVPALITFLLHFFWILPVILMGRNPASELTDIYTSSASLSFFSFAKLENTISFLHPNWPENLFGKVSFLRSEFLIISILAFSSLLFILKDNTKKIYFLSLVFVSIVGIFLAKGVNEPFGIIYETAFNTIPGFVMFRDPTKWYMLISISFAILIPFSLLKISELKRIKKFSILIPVLFILFWAFLIKDSFSGVVGGTLSPKHIPANYQKLADMLTSENSFSRTLWIPTYPTLAYMSNTHPAVPAVEFFQATSTANLISILENPETEQILVDTGIKYVVVPEDIYGKIFLNDRKYDEKIYRNTLDEIKKVNYLSPKGEYGKLAVFEVTKPKDHFWAIGEGIVIISKYISPTKYEIDIRNAKKDDVIVFTESYDKFWEARLNKDILPSMSFKVSKNQIFNSFVLPQSGDYKLSVVYKPQEWLNKGLVISVISLVVIILLLFKSKDKK